MIAKMFSDSTMQSMTCIISIWHVEFVRFHYLCQHLFPCHVFTIELLWRMTGTKKRNIFSFYWGLLINLTSNFEKKKFDSGKPLWGGGFRAVHFLFHFWLSIYMCVCVYIFSLHLFCHINKVPTGPYTRCGRCLLTWGH